MTHSDALLIAANWWLDTSGFAPWPNEGFAIWRLEKEYGLNAATHNALIDAVGTDASWAWEVRAWFCLLIREAIK